MARSSRQRLLIEPRQLHLLRACAVGLFAGLMSLGFAWSLNAVDLLRERCLVALHARIAWGWVITSIVAAALCGLAGWLTARFAPEAGGSGIPHVKAVLLRLKTLRWKRIIPVKVIGGVLGMGAGLSMGREGPTVQVGAAVGEVLAGLLRVPRRSRAHMVACGAGAGLAAAFNAPLAGFIFVIEELRRELSPITYGTALIAAVCADMIMRAFQGQMPSFHVRGYPSPPLAALPVVAFIGVLAGLLGVLFNRGLLWTMALLDRWPPGPKWTRAVLVGAVVGIVAWWWPEALGGGQRTAERVLRGEFAAPQFARFVVFLLFVKFGLTLFSYGGGTPGGVFAPMLLIGALLGLVIGMATARIAPSLGPSPAAFSVIGMAALFSAVVRAPLTGIVLIVEMTANYEQVFALTVACLIAYVVAERLREPPLYETLLRRDIEAAPPAASDSDEPAIVHKVIEPHCGLDGRFLRNAGLPAGCLIATIRRAGVETVPAGDTRLQGGDEIVVIVSGHSSRALHQLDEMTRQA